MRTIPLLMLGLALSTSPVAAFELFGIRLWGEPEVAEVDLIDPLPYRIALTIMADDTDISADVAQTVSAAAQLVSRADRPALGRAGLLSTANGDYGRILDALYGRGYFGGSVSIKIDGGEAAELALDGVLSDSPLVLITIQPGPTFSFGKTRLRNAPEGGISDEIGFISGLPAEAGVIGDAAAAGITAWRDAGHAKAALGAVSVVADHNNKTVDADVTIQPGPRATIGALQVEGTAAVDPGFIQYIANIKPGERFDPKALKAARTRLQKLDTFTIVDIQEGAQIAPDGTLPFTISVKDRKPRRIGAGVTVSSLDGISLEGFWLHRNVFGKAQRLRFDGRIAGIGRTDDPENYDYSVFGTYQVPGVLNPSTDFTLKIGADRERTETYDTLARITSAGLSTTFSEELTGDMTLINERSRTEDDLGERTVSVTGIEFGLTYDSRDTPLDARSGYYLSADIFPLVVSSQDSTGLRAVAEARGYSALDRDGQLILAGRAKIGSLFGISQRDASTDILFYAGGGGSVRGFDYRAIGVETEDGTLGGRSLVELSGELRYSVTDRFGLVGFVDGGIVGDTPEFNFDNDFRSAAGVGLRYQTGLGPLRLDIARAQDRRKGEPNLGIYIGLGQAF